MAGTSFEAFQIVIRKMPSSKADHQFYMIGVVFAFVGLFLLIALNKRRIARWIEEEWVNAGRTRQHRSTRNADTTQVFMSEEEKQQKMEERRLHLKSHFENNNLITVVTESSFVDVENQDSFSNYVEDEISSNQIKIVNDDIVSDFCAVCLGSYQIGDKIISSLNKDCPHVFHDECITTWLVKMHDESPCPCCRQDFVVDNLVEEKP